jgi:hypothetical protein
MRRNTLQYIPVLDNLPVVIDSEDVNPGPITVVRPVLKVMQHHEVAIGQDAAELHAFAWYSRAIRSKYSMNASLPSATTGLCCV